MPAPRDRSLPPAAIGLAIAAASLLTLGLLGIDRGDELLGHDRLPRQLAYAALGLLVAIGGSRIDYRIWRSLAGPAFAVSCVALVAVFLFDPRGGSRRWIPLGPIDVQPSEVVKLAFVVLAASQLSLSRQTLSPVGVVKTLLLAVIPMVLIVREPDLGTAILFGPTAAAMLLAAGSRRRDLLAIAVVAACLLPALWLGMSAEQRSRVTTLASQADGGPAPQGDGYHLHQSKQVLALGGATGIAVDDLLAREPLSYHLPAARTDFILCLIGQRFGLAGTLATLACVAALVGSLVGIGGHTRDPFGRLVCVGLAAMLGTQATVNAAMTVGLMPITGVTLPLCSYGGTSLVATAAAIGLALSIARHAPYEVAETLYWWEAESSPSQTPARRPYVRTAASQNAVV